MSLSEWPPVLDGVMCVGTVAWAPGQPARITLRAHDYHGVPCCPGCGGAGPLEAYVLQHDYQVVACATCAAKAAQGREAAQ